MNRMSMRTFFVLAAVSLLLTGGSNADDKKSDVADKIDVNQPITAERSNNAAFDIDYRIIVTPPHKTKVLKVWLPIPQSDNAQKISKLNFCTFPVNVEPKINVEKNFGNKFAYFEFKNPAGAQIIEFKFNAKISQLNWQLDLSQIQPVGKWPTEFKPFLRDEFDTSFQTQIDQVIGEIVPKRKGTALDMEAVMKWTDENLTYSHTAASLKADAQHALTKRTGHCSDYHGLCSALGRQLGFPARVTYGLAMFSKASPSHCKLEVFLPPHGWVTFDVSETQKMIKAIESNESISAADKKQLLQAARNRLLSGFRDNTWLQVTKGTNYELVPKAAAGSVPLIRTIYAEADGKALPEPNPTDQRERKFSWMTAYRVDHQREVKYPFKDISSLKTR